MDKLDAMRLFSRVANLGSFSAVAVQLGVARSVVTRQVAALESHLGAKLLARSTRRLSLTPAGAAYLERCRAILDLVDVAEAGIAEDHQTPRGLIRLSLPLVYGLKYLAPWLLEFSQRYPEVELDMDFSDRRANLIKEGIDLAVRITPRLDPNDVARRLGSGRMVVVASPGYIEQHGEPKHPSELVRHHCLGYTATANAQRWAFSVDGRIESFAVARSRLQANNGEVLLKAACAGLGIAYEPMFSAGELLASGQLVEVLKDFAPPEIGIYAVLPDSRHVPHRLRVLMDFLRARIGEEGSAETLR
ncbi:LysR family transcriptional regulator [Propionivibrio soli]|uniref:LysR family transcriptional regulator n=1 Tax=Propionivibrio soli TaxID=2976531 RepID=UPI0021E95F72|nr:LysR family transcriptional regulator [Propionivibrio soli]